jgi:AcrR family transcriptional regulator
MVLTRREKTPISLRKEPQQARSRHLVDAVLEAAVRILNDGGSFTMAAIAETAGVSVGSLYQYFPNKQAVLFRLQTEEWQQTASLIEAALSDRSTRPDERLRLMIRLFFRSECEEAPFRRALDEALPLYRHTPEGEAQHRRSKKIMSDFIGEALPHAGPATRAFAADFVKTTITAMGKRLSDRERPLKEIDAFAAAAADMLNGWLERQG